MRGFHAYFQDGRVSARIIDSLLQQVTHLLHVIECHNQHRFSASSLLLVYDSDDSDAAPRVAAASGDDVLSLECEWCASADIVDAKGASPPHCAARAHMIDFGHVTPLVGASEAADGGSGDVPVELRDRGYAHGLRTICAALRALVVEYSQQ